MIKKMIFSGFILLFILILGCSQHEIIGYTYDLDEKNNQIKLDNIYSFKHEIDGDQIIGEMKIGKESVSFNAVKADSRVEYILYTGIIEFDDVKYNFDIFISSIESASGLLYDDSREFVNGFLIEKINKIE